MEFTKRLFFTTHSARFHGSYPKKALSYVRRADARSRQIGGPDGISQVLQVSAYSGEPFSPKAARNLLSKDRCRTALGDEAVKSGPEVSFVGMAASLSRARKRLTGTGSGPYWPFVGPAGEAEGIGPAENSAKEMCLAEPGEVCGIDVGNGSAINFAIGDQPRSNKVPCPFTDEGI
jgi:hypothetical protein